MDERFWALLMVFGLALTAAGAGIAAQGVFISGKKLDLVSGTYWDENPHLRKMLVEQSTQAKRGLQLIVAGTILQIIATAVPLIWR